MKHNKKRLTPKQYLINRQAAKDTFKTDVWLYENGIYLSNWAVGDKEVFQAAKLVTETLRKFRHLLDSEENTLLDSYMLKIHNPIKRNKITKKQSYQVMNISKKIKRLAAKLGY